MADSTTLPTPDAEALERALVATSVAFVAAGILMASWASRIPQIRDGLGLEPSELGRVLLAIAIGSLVSLPLSGPLVARIGSGRIVAITAVLFGTGLVIAAVGYRVGVVPVVAGLFLVGFAAGAWDVAMNVHGASVETQLGRSVMSRFHAGFSLGTVAGALVGAAMVALEVSVTVHLVATAVIVTSCVLVATGSFLPEQDHGADAEPTEAPAARGAFASWGEPRTLLIGVFVLAFAFAEGVGNDWIAVAMIDDHGASDAIGTLAFATFLSAMTLGRWFGPGALDRYGRARVVRVLAFVGIAGTILFVVAPTIWLVFPGAVLWGLGTSLGFPVGMSAGADEPAFAAGRVSVISSIGYCAFLAGPPLIGFLGDRFSVLHALIAVAVLLCVAAVVAPAVQPIGASSDR